jgi:hypothetical protein
MSVLPINDGVRQKKKPDERLTKKSQNLLALP